MFIGRVAKEVTTKGEKFLSYYGKLVEGIS
jgi:hypothetical protein